MFHKSLSLVLTFATLLSLAFTCGQGELSLNGCQRISYIEGCLQYSSSHQCSLCEFNYDLINGRCDYNPQPIEKCCLAFGANGQCTKCQSGLFLDDGACKQADLVGCLTKTGSSCNNCADGFFLNNGRCSEGIKRCNLYNKNGVCSSCVSGYSLSGGACLPSALPNCALEQNGKCSKCIEPFTLISNGVCQIANCAKSSEYGCIECVSSYFVTQSGTCSPFEAGCRSYKRGSCVDCFPGFVFNNGVCNMVGCSLQSNGVCKTCTQGYQLGGDGVCRIPNCLHSIQDTCLICNAGYHIASGKCQPIASNCINYVGEVCRSCAPGYFLGSDGKCAIQEPGCNKYSQGICVECSSPFLISPTGKCVIDGCDKSDASGCLSCRAPYFLSGKICRLPNCEKALNGLCSLCSKNYHLYNKQCVVDDINCQGYDLSGRCTGCTANFYLSSINTCISKQPGCIYSSSTCSSCSSPFTFSNGACSIPNCKSYNFQGCTTCHSKYYLSSSLTCLQQEIGGIYVGGVLTGCSSPFVFNSLAKKCEIQGCTKYAPEGCLSCMSPYKLNKNTCRIDNCIKSEKGQCLQCDNGFKIQNGLCTRFISNCLEYNLNGCQTCANLFYLSSAGDACLPVEPGCIYSNGKCVKCSDPFTLNNGACIIQGCSVFDVLGCKTCKTNFYLDSGKCLLPNCKTLLNGMCSGCDDGFQLSTGICKATDKCNQLSSNGTCKVCSKGFSPNICGRCVPTVGNCAYYGRNGKCEQCINNYFLTKDFACQIRDKGCKSYVAGVCTECVANYFLYDGICFPFTEGCLKYQGKDCVTCSTGYSLSKGICLKASNKLTKGLVFDDWVTTNITSNITDTSSGKDIEFDTVAAKNPASGAKIGTLFYSSVFSSNYNTYGINSSYGWKSAKSVVGQWAGIQLSSGQTFYQLQIQAGENGNYVSEFEIEFSVDGVEFKKVPGIFTADLSGSKISKVSFTPVYAIAIRFVVTKYIGWPSARFDFIYNNIDEKTDWAGLFSTNQINKKIYAISSSRLSNQLDINIRRFFNPVRDCDNKEKCWSGIELCEPKNVTAINFPTTTNTTGSLTEFYIDYSLDGNYFSCYQNCTAIPVATNKFTFKNALKAKNVRVHPTKWIGTPQVQFTFDYN